MTLVRLQWRTDRQVRCTVPIQHIHELLLLQGPDDARTALRIRCNILPGDDPTAAAAAEGLLVDFDEGVLVFVVVQNDDTARI